MFYLISYDVTDDYLRRRVEKTLQGSGTRVQFSVFECSLDAAEHRALLERLELEFIQSEKRKSTDSIRIYRICGECTRTIQVMGFGEVAAEPNVIVV